VKWFAKSSGTTNDRSKYIPVSREALEDCHYKGGKDLIALHYEQFPQSKLFMGMSMVVGGSSTIERFRQDAYSGDLSAIIIRNLPIWVEIRRTPVIEVALMENWEEKIERMARETMREDVRCIAGVPSWTLIILRRILELTGKRQHAGSVAEPGTVHAWRRELQALPGAVPRVDPSPHNELSGELQRQ
jgi:hypothetical protein